MFVQSVHHREKGFTALDRIICVLSLFIEPINIESIISKISSVNYLFVLTAQVVGPILRDMKKYQPIEL